MVVTETDVEGLSTLVAICSCLVVPVPLSLFPLPLVLPDNVLDLALDPNPELETDLALKAEPERSLKTTLAGLSGCCGNGTCGGGLCGGGITGGGA